jgi:hypothetical protein
MEKELLRTVTGRAFSLLTNSEGLSKKPARHSSRIRKKDWTKVSDYETFCLRNDIGVFVGCMPKNKASPFDLQPWREVITFQQRVSA